MIRKSLGELAALVGGEVVGDPAIEVSGAADIADACEGDIVFAESPKHLTHALKSAAVAVIARPEALNSHKPLIRTANPRLAFAKVLGALAPSSERPLGIHPTASVGSNLQSGDGLSVGSNAFIGDDVSLGSDVWIHPLVYIGNNVRIGSGCVLHPSVSILDNVTIGDNVIIHAGAVVGSDGFGYTLAGTEHFKIPQVGTVVIGDDVEIGANVTIDRARTGKTVIGRGTKIDNLVHIAHNVALGRHCIITGQVGFAGSTRVGDYCVVAAQSGIADHLKIGHQVTIGAKSGVMRDIPDGAKVLGIPAVPDQQAKRQIIAAQHLPELLRRMRELEKQVEQLQAKVNG